MRSRTSIVVSAGGLLALAALARGTTYSVIDLGSLGGEWSHAFGIGPDGRVVGHALIDANVAHHAFASFEGAITDLGTVGGKPLSQAFDVDQEGRAVGTAYGLGDLDPRAFRADGAGPVELGAFAARAATPDGGLVVGAAHVSTGYWTAERGVVWTEAGLGVLPTLGGDNSVALDVDSSGRIVGSSFLAGERINRGCAWVNGVPHQFGTLGGQWSQAQAINDAGIVVGVAATPSGAPHAFRTALSAGGVPAPLQDLGVLSGHDSAAFGVNGAGDVVGVSDGRGVVWPAGGGIVDLNTLIPQGSGWVLERARAVSDSGLIAGSGTHNGLIRAFLLAPACTGDLDADGLVGSTDLNVVLAGFGHSVTPGTSGDIDASGFVDSLDLNILLSLFGSSCR